ncbi:alpha/beta hydrolase [Actinocorallia longicatena]|uniref:Alpha/beta hydrolase n=1 Tax=Actinocorallia longicatena TaxID=111803 RepID=A0ABP6Q1K9_9ACTN
MDLLLGPDSPPTRQSKIANKVIRQAARRLWETAPDTTAGLLRVRRWADRVGATNRVPNGVEIVQEDFGRFGGEWVRSRVVDEGKVFLYLHGGGYFFGNPRLFRGLSWRLSAATRRPVLMVDYRLSPEHTPADALTDAMLAYESLLARGHAPGDIVVGGDSAGGHLALSLLHALKRRGETLPAAAVVICPWADLLCTAASHADNERTDHLIPASKVRWLGGVFTEGADEQDALHDPIRGDYTGFPPLMVIASSTEVLRDDARLVARLATEAGVDVVHQEWNDQVHVFPVFADFVPEGKAAFRHIREFLGKR